MSGARLWLVGAVCACATLAPAAYVVAASGGAEGEAPARSVRPASSTAGLPAGPHLLFQSTEPQSYGLLAAVPRGTPEAPSVATGRTCERIDARGGRIACLTVDAGLLNTVHAYVLDERLQELHDLPVKGIPSRVRLSPDGSRVAVTVFVTGHSYAGAGFSTSTTIWDTESGQQVAELERFRFTHDGAVVDAADRNFWGVTFSGDGTTFYATMATGGRTHLVRADLARGTGETVADGVECPSLSPDETRVAFKQRRPGDVVSWALAVLDLRTLERNVLPVEHHVDDQPYWLDEDTVTYGAARAQTGEGAGRRDTFAVRADGSAAPHMLRRDAWSLVDGG